MLCVTYRFLLCLFCLFAKDLVLCLLIVFGFILFCLACSAKIVPDIFCSVHVCPVQDCVVWQLLKDSKVTRLNNSRVLFICVFFLSFSFLVIVIFFLDTIFSSILHIDFFCFLFIIFFVNQ